MKIGKGPCKKGPFLYKLLKRTIMNKISINIFLAACSMAASINAYENSFFNNTNRPVGIAIQYTGNDTSEPLYKKRIKPGTLFSFEPGKQEIPAIKWAFCLDNIYYVDNPTPDQKAHNFAKTIWKKIPITWTTQSSTTKPHAKRRPAGILANEKTSASNKSLCRDRHFDIVTDKNGKIIIKASLTD